MYAKPEETVLNCRYSPLAVTVPVVVNNDNIDKTEEIRVYVEIYANCEL